MSASAMVANSTAAIPVVAPDSCKARIHLQAIPEHNPITPARRVASVAQPSFDYFNPHGNENIPDVLQERAALERIAYAFSRAKDD